jgi:hypothetical protein
MSVENQASRVLEPRRGGTGANECRPYGALIPLHHQLTTDMPPLRGSTAATPQLTAIFRFVYCFIWLPSPRERGRG